jgi:hypothetical protein
MYNPTQKKKKASNKNLFDPVVFFQLVRTTIKSRENSLKKAEQGLFQIKEKMEKWKV